MNVFIDTNIVANAILQQPNGNVSQRVLDVIDSGEARGHISVGSFYTLIYLFDKNFKRNGVEKERRKALLRHIMDVLLDKFSIVEQDYLSLYLSIHDDEFDDMEDGCQYHAAIKAGCELLVTDNVRDFIHAKGTVKVVTPEDFVNRFVPKH